MKKIKTLIGIVFLMLLLCVSVSAAEEVHTHCVCGGDVPAGHTCSDLVWQEWDGKDITEPGNYYLPISHSSVDYSIEITADAHICLNGNNINFLSNRSVDIPSGVSVSFCDCSEENTGGIGGAQGLATVAVYGNLDVYQGYYRSTHSAIYNFSTGTINFYNGKINANGSSYPNGITNEKGVFNIYDGIFHGYDQDICKYSGTVSVMGGIYTKVVPAELIADGYECVENPDSSFYCYKVQKKPHTHCVCGGDVPAGHTCSDIVWQEWKGENIAEAGNYYLTESIGAVDRNITITADAHICLNGKSIGFLTNRSVNIESGVTVSFCDCSEENTGGIGGAQVLATVAVYGNLDVYQGYYRSTDCAIYNYSTGTVNFYNGKINANGSPYGYPNGVTNEKGVFNIYDGIFHGYNMDICRYSGTVSVMGGIYTKVVSADLIADGYECVANPDDSFYCYKVQKKPHTHCVCGGDVPAGHTCTDIVWKEWNGESITEAGNYYLTKSIGAVDRNITITADAHICLNGKSIGFLTNRSVNIESGVSVSFCDCSEENTGHIGGAQVLATIAVYGNLDVYQGYYSSTDCAIYNYSTGTVNFYNGEINANGSPYGYPNGINNSKGTLNIYNGIFHGYNKDINKYSGTVSIMGGIYTKVVPADLIADGYECVANPDDSFYCYKVQKKPHTHCVCGGDVPAGHTCTDIVWKEWNGENIAEAGNYYLTKSIGAVDRNITITADAHICLNGKSIGFLTNRSVDIPSGVSVSFCDCSEENTGGISGAQVLATIAVYGNLDVYQGYYSSTDCAIYNYSTGTVNFYNGEINANGSPYGYPNGINNSKGTLNIYDGIFHGYNKDINKYSGTVSIMGGIYTKVVPADLLAEGYECVVNPDDSFYCYKVQKVKKITISNNNDQIHVFNPDSVTYEDITVLAVYYLDETNFVVAIAPQVDVLADATTYVPVPEDIDMDQVVQVKVFLWYDLVNLKPIPESAAPLES